MKKFGINNSMNFDKNKKLNRMFLEIKLGQVPKFEKITYRYYRRFNYRLFEHSLFKHCSKIKNTSMNKKIQTYTYDINFTCLIEFDTNKI